MESAQASGELGLGRSRYECRDRLIRLASTAGANGADFSIHIAIIGGARSRHRFLGSRQGEV